MGSAEHDTGWAFNNQRFSDMTLILTTPGGMELARTSNTGGPPRKLRSTSAHTWGVNKVAVDGQEQLQRVLLSQGGIKLAVSKVILASGSYYFKKRLESEDWAKDPWITIGADRELLLVVGVEGELMEAAQAVVQFMYEKAVPAAAGPLQLARMCTVADMWCYTACFRQCLKALAQHPEATLSLDVLASVLDRLPQAVHTLAECDDWQTTCVRAVCGAPALGMGALAVLLHMFGDVHALLTSPQLLQHFRKLPFSAIKAWADSDDLVVDTEDSMAVVLGWWVGGGEGSKCSEEQLKDLSGVLRLRHMSTAFRCGPLLSQTWFKYDARDLDGINAAVETGVFAFSQSPPSGWIKLGRKQLQSVVLKQRCTIHWDLPQAQLESMMASTAAGQVASAGSPSTVYLGGTGIQLFCEAERDGTDTHFGVYMATSSYTQHGTILCQARAGFPCRCTIQRHMNRERNEWPKWGMEMDAWKILGPRGAGRNGLITATTTADLGPQLVDGCFKLKATVNFIPG